MIKTKQITIIIIVMSTFALVIGQYPFQYTASTKLDVWKIHNESLVKAIQANSQFSDVKVLTSPESYSIILEYSLSLIHI